MYLLLINIIIPSIRGGVFVECGYIIINNVRWIIVIIITRGIRYEVKLENIVTEDI